MTFGVGPLVSGLVSVLGRMRVGRAALPLASVFPGDWAKASFPKPQAMSASAATTNLGISLLPL
jgi:hypothetical protein